MQQQGRCIRFSALDGAVQALWAKSGEPLGHPLLCHLLDVAAVAEMLLVREPSSTRVWVAQAFGLSEAQAVRWIAALAGLHDFGKAIPGFQAKWPEGMRGVVEQGLPFDAKACEATDHGCATGVLLVDALSPLCTAERSWLLPAVQAISAHHGYHHRPSDEKYGRPLREGTQWREVRQSLLEAYWGVLNPEGAPSTDDLTTPAVDWLAGLTCVADWIASNPVWFPLGPREDDLAQYHARSMVLAEQALEAIGWAEAAPLLAQTALTDRLLGRIVGADADLPARPLQTAGDQLLAEASGPALLLVEAPMGEGKTELAFLAHLRLQAANGHRGLYVALPTQATGNALFKRALTFLRHFARSPLDMQLVHGGAAMNEEVRHLRGVNDSGKDSVSASAWFSQRRRPLLSAYGVGTIDQALFAGLNVKHHFARLWGLGNRVVVLDEVHAYDTYTSGLIESLLRWLKAMGSSVVLMSATLPKARRDALVRAWGIEAGDIPELPYPRLVLADEQGIRGKSFAARPLPVIQLLGISESLQSLAECAESRIASGGCGAIIVNTVDRAQQLYGLLKERLGDSTALFLFHARFPADQRGELEQLVLDRFGRNGERPARALLIATQVAEQSLDLDFDFMLSDLAPVDLLLQRAGRLHRHRRERLAAHQQARFYVAGLLPEQLPDLKETAWGFVYDPYILGRTWALLSREAALQLPHDIDRLVQSVYGDDPLPDELEAKVRDFIEIEAFGEYRAKVNNERMQAQNIAINPAEEPQSAYLDKPRGNEEGVGLGLTNRTRLGEESVVLVPVYLTGQGWSLKPDGEAFDPDQPITDEQARQLYQRQIRLSRTAVVKHFLATEAPGSFRENPLLSSFRPLVLRSGLCEFGALSLVLDSSLGLVIKNAGRGHPPA